jgi:carboxyl-terminal processing protease
MSVKRHGVVLVLMLCMVIPIILAGIACGADKSKEPLLTEEQRKLNIESFEKIWSTIRDKHYDPNFGGIDWQAVHDELLPKIEKAERMSEARTVLKDLIHRLGLSHFNLIPIEVYNKLGKPGEKGASDGVTGIDFRIVNGHALVTFVPNDSSAQKTGVKTGWEIVKINKDKVSELLPDIAKEFEGNSLKDYYMFSAIKSRLYGKIGDTLDITFLDENNKSLQLTIPLREEQGNKFKLGYLPPMYIWLKSETIENGTGKTGYIAFNGFLDAPRIMPAFNEAVKSFIDNNVDGIVIDIRGNGGGLPMMAMGMAGWLIEKKDRRLGTMYFRDSELKMAVLPRPEIFKGPVAVLVDGLSASCSEIFAGGLKDLGRARIFGSTTAGAVLPSIVEKLPNDDGFQYAFANYRSENGDILEGNGVKPDVEVYHTREALLQGKDLILEAALDWIKKSSGVSKEVNKL